MDSDKAGNAEDLDNKKLQLIYTACDRRLLSSQRVVDGINSMDYSKLKILCKYHNKFSYKGIEELLSDESIVNHINDYDDEIFRYMLNDAPSEHNILEILKGEEVRSSEFDSSDGEENEEDYGYYDNFDYEEDEKNDPNNFAKEALGDKGTNEKRVDGVQFYLNEETLKCIFESGKLSDEDVIKLLENKEILERINSIAPERFQLILNSGKFNGTSIIGLLESKNAARNIDLIDKETLKYIIENDKLSNKGIIKLLEDQEILERINSIAPERFQLILNSGKFDDINIIVELLKNKKVAKNINLLSEELFEQIVKNNEFSSEHIIKALEDREFIKLIKLIDPGKSKIILNSDKFNDTSVIVELLKNKGIAENINIISEELLKYIVKSDRFSSEYIIKVLKDREFVKLIDLIDPGKSKSVFRKFDYTIIIELLKNQEVVERINSMNRKIFDLIFKYSDQGYIMNLLKDQSLFDQINSLDESKVSIMKSDYFFTDKEIAEIIKTSLPQLHSIDGNRLKIICKSIKFDSTDVREILKDQSLFVRVNSIDLEKLELISSSSKFDRSMVMDLLKSRNFIDSIDTEKFRLLLDNASLNDKRIITLLKDQNAVEKINSVTTKELKAITDNVTGKVFVNIFKNFKPSVKSTLRLAILLRKAGKITDINIDYLNNKERIYEDIIKYVPQDLRIYTQYPFPGIGIDVKDLPQGLDIDIEPFIPLSTFKRCTESKEPVSKLYNLSLEQVIENINPHKKARYS
ncbi:ligand-binding sensor domain-containing protein [Wolbachia endosymbiont of Bemisia tabaci]|uniref:hypothetical protein n=1 Tax=Wolbachia endosymbiont of Bemisia tabaci TaxID=215173 RepID=UPI000D556C76|nr:hypothetical protein [Wolbachia endosymbiont of Bemisia tabaci]